ncbi:MAG: acyltransferase [Actinomycetales bacterium]|nr:acyltransferase [Actinomycetales bacterium]
MVQPAKVAESNVRKDIQGLRTLAVLLVIAFHLGLPIPGGFIGVDVFFVISGFVITAMLEREWNQNSRISISRFFLRRFWRLTPALAIVVATTLLLGAVILSAYGPQRLMMLTGLGAMLLSANAVIARFTGGYFDVAADTNPLLNTWSLSVEEQFYIGFLLLLILGWSIGKFIKAPKITVLVVVSVVFATSLAVALLAQPGHLLDNSNWLFHFYSPVNRAWEFAAGSLLALLNGHVEKLPRAMKNFNGLFGIALILFSAFYISEAKVWPGSITVLPIVGTILLIASYSLPGSIPDKLLANKWAVYLGDRSYSLYLWHWPVIVLLGYLVHSEGLQIILALGISSLLTLATYRWVETPLRHNRPTKKFLVASLAVVIFSAPIVIAIGVYAANKHYFWSASLRHQKIALAKGHITDQNGCNKHISNLHKSADSCAWNLNAPGEPVYLVGDSNASQYSDGFIAAAKSSGHPLYTAIGVGCPFLLEPYAQPDRNVLLDGGYADCSSFALENYSWLKSQPKGLVVISNTDLYANIPSFRVVGNRSPATSSENQYFYLLGKSIKTLVKDGFKVAVISGPIHFDSRMENFPEKYDWEPSECTLLSQISNSCDVTMPLAKVKNFQGKYWNSLRDITLSSGATLIDLSLEFCDEKSCSSQANGLQIYRDGRHTTYDADLTLIPRFTSEINRIFSAK